LQRFSAYYGQSTNSISLPTGAENDSNMHSSAFKPFQTTNTIDLVFGTNGAKWGQAPPEVFGTNWGQPEIGMLLNTAHTR
jgi:hypothetical protein